jgi:hypothetical protein
MVKALKTQANQGLLYRATASLTGYGGRFPDGVFRAVNSGGSIAITGELRVSVFL